MSKKKYRFLILGASYGSLLGIKLLLTGHSVRLVCLPAESRVINQKGILVRLPVRGFEEPIEISSPELTGELDASGAESVDVGAYDLAVFAMQEPQFRNEDVKRLLSRIAAAALPCMSIMNMPPVPFLRRLPGIDIDPLLSCYTDPSVWDGFNPDLFTLASPDPQAFRPPEEAANVLQVGLPTNFKVARFETEENNQILRQIQSDIETATYATEKGDIVLPVKVKVHDSVFVPLAKWNMLITGNYRCILPDRIRSIRETVHGDLEASRAIYEWVGSVCRKLGGSEADQVPFEKYAAAAKGLAKPSSAARAIAGGATHIERVDRLVAAVAMQHDMHHDELSKIIALVDAMLAGNRSSKSG